jgi:hypothetical protein
MLMPKKKLILVLFVRLVKFIHRSVTCEQSHTWQGMHSVTLCAWKDAKCGILHEA